MRRPSLRFLVVVVVVAAVGLEAVLVALRHLPALAAVPPLTELARELYMVDRTMINVRPGDAVAFDPVLSYTLKPGRFSFANTEYDTTCEVNRLGVRDDQASLERPRVVVVGDSFAMGWGVDQGETFADVLEQRSGWRVLNTGVSSYGTARELMMLERVDLSATTHLVIQFCNNDFAENEQFVANDGELVVHSAESFAAMADRYPDPRYVAGRYGWHFLSEAARAVGAFVPGARAEGPSPVALDPSDPAVQQLQVAHFLGVLDHSPVDLAGLEVIVFELNGYNRHRQHFAPLLREALDGRELPAGMRSLTVLDLAAELGPEHWFVLDDHLRPSGHRLVGARLWQVIEAGEASGDEPPRP